MGCKTPRHLVRTAVVLLLSLDSLSRALQTPARPHELREPLAQTEGDYVPTQLDNHHNQHHHHQRKHQPHSHQRHTQNQGRQRHQASLGNSSSYSLISGPGSNTNGGTDYRPPLSVNTHRVHQHWLTVGGSHGGAVAGGHQDTPPQHRRHHPRGQHQLPQQPHPHQQQHQPPLQPVANSWRRTLVTSTRGEGSASSGRTAGGTARPVTRMLTRSGTGSYDGTHHSNKTRQRTSGPFIERKSPGSDSGQTRWAIGYDKNICTVYMYRKTIRTSNSMQPCLDATNCGQRTYSYPVAKRETCCRGWETTTTVADGCFKPICQTACRNGGKCTAPDRCSCPAGFTGKSCELDVNECKEYKPCDQTCYNTEGSYYCTCRDGFMLQSDRQSCKKIDETNDIATEARDMENDVDYDSLDIRLKKLEQDERKSYNERQELNKKVQYTMDAMSVLKSQVARLTTAIESIERAGLGVHQLGLDILNESPMEECGDVGRTPRQATDCESNCQPTENYKTRLCMILVDQTTLCYFLE
uniref:EGF-like domain-containing protein n=1 Tax=Anopheles atroparvus TaxID=41427 RepID=A0A182J038_ANOAO